MKHLNLFIILFSLLICSKAFSNDLPPVTPSPTPRAHSLAIPISITVNNTDLTIHFNKAIGETAITITDETGEIVYQGTTDTSISLDFYIPTDTLDSGNYTISFDYGSNTLTENFEL
jgi:hypothetical protein